MPMYYSNNPRQVGSIYHSDPAMAGKVVPGTEGKRGQPSATAAKAMEGSAEGRAQLEKTLQAQRAETQQARDAAQEAENRQWQASRVQDAINNSANRPTDAIYAHYLAGSMPGVRVWGAIKKQIEDRLGRMGISTGDAPTAETYGVPPQGGIAVPGTNLEKGSALVDRMVQAELDRLRAIYRGFTPQRNQAAGETEKEWQARIAAAEEVPVPGDIPEGTIGDTEKEWLPYIPTTVDIAPFPGEIPGVDIDFPTPTESGFISGGESGITIPAGMTASQYQQQLNDARRFEEVNRIAVERPWSPGDGTPFLGDGTPFTGTPYTGAPDPGAPIGPGGLLSRQALIEEQKDPALFLRGLQEATGRGLGEFIPVAQRAISRAFSRFGDVSPITNYFPQQERGASWRDYLKGPQPTAESLQASLGNILGDFANRPSNLSPAFAKFSTTFGTPQSAISAAAQPYLTRIAPRLRGAAQTGIFNMFGPQFATSPQQYQTPEQIFGVFKDFQSKGF
jgi:hypothetical protein